MYWSRRIQQQRQHTKLVYHLSVFPLEMVNRMRKAVKHHTISTFTIQCFWWIFSFLLGSPLVPLLLLLVYRFPKAKSLGHIKFNVFLFCLYQIRLQQTKWKSQRMCVCVLCWPICRIFFFFFFWSQYYGTIKLLYFYIFYFLFLIIDEMRNLCDVDHLIWQYNNVDPMIYGFDWNFFVEMI